MPTPTPAHRLGPHVVGQRVVIRRIVPGGTGPTGGPAFTDVLGICTAWGPSVAVVDSASGPIEIPLALIVSGKPVPPRPSVRMRVHTRDAELRTARLWPDVSVAPLGEWQLRTCPEEGGRLVKRANSCLAIGDPGLPVREALRRVVDHYDAHRQRPLVQVEADSDVETAARAAGWTPLEHGEAAFLIASLARVRRVLGGPAPADGNPPRVSADGHRSRVSVHDTTGLEIASGRAVLDGDWLALHDLRVAPTRRRQGLARAVIAALLEWGAERGAVTVWLHVETDNVPALALYDSLGFAEHHRARYLSVGA